MSRSFHPYGRPGWQRPISHSVRWKRWRRFVKASDYRTYYNAYAQEVTYGPMWLLHPSGEPKHERKRAEKCLRAEWRQPKPDWDDYVVPSRWKYRLPYSYWW